MNAPAEKAPSAAPAGSARPRSWRRLCFLSAVALVVGATLLLPRVSRVAPDPLRPPAFMTGRWWTTPLEVGAASRLARVDADLLTVAAAPDGQQVLVGGRHGTLLASADGGATWRPERVLVHPPPAEASKPAVATPAKREDAKPAEGKPAKDPRLADKEKKAEEARRQTEDARRRGAETIGRAVGDGDSARGRPTPIEADRPANRQAPRPAGDRTAPAPNAPARPYEQRDEGKKKGGSKASLDIFRWLVPQAHAAEPPPPEVPAAPASAPPAQTSPAAAKAEEALVDAEDDIVWLAAAGATWGARTASGTRVQRGADGTWTPDVDADVDRISRSIFPGKSRLISISGRYAILSTGPIVRDGQPGPALERARAIAVTRDQKEAFAVRDDRVWTTSASSPDWTPLGAPALVPLRGLHFADDKRGWVVGAGGELLSTDDAGGHWTACATRAPVPLNAVFFLPDGKQGWVVGNDGYIATSDDGGATLVSRTRPRSLAGARAPVTLPSPWYLASWLIAFGLFFVGRSIPSAKEAMTTRAVMQAFTSDRPLEKGEPDVLKLSELASGLSRFLRNDATKPPLTVAITGPWGTGKSSLMNLLRADLRSFGFNPVWFNAWHHQKEEHLLASLLQAIRNQAIPPVWRREGLMFRAHLLLIRARKHAFKILLLLFVCGAMLGSATSSDNPFENVDKVLTTLQGWAEYLLNPGATKPPASPLDQLAGLGLSHLPGIGAFATLAFSLFRGLRAFGLNPGALLASNANSSKLADLDAQSSFRDKFRTEYNEVSAALGVRTLLVFIDDLDRCQPEQVLDVLESINYLVTSGDCFVILGVDRSRVEPCVALGFKEISAEMSGKDDRDHRQQYAVQYLDKLINIEVPIPRLEPSEARALLVSHSEEDGAAAKVTGSRERRPSPLGKTVAELFDIVRPSFRLWPFAVAAAAFMGGYGMKHEPREKAAGVVANTGGETAQPAAGPSKALDPGGKPVVTEGEDGKSTKEQPLLGTGGIAATVMSEVAKAIDAEIAGRPEQRGQFVAALPAGTPIGSLFWLFVAAWGGFMVFQIVGSRPELVVKDSDEFVAAWKAWAPIIFSQATTPRALKRFQNRVRFLSMRQQAATDERGWSRRLVDRLLGRHEEAEDLAAEAAARTSLDEQPIPDLVLVELAAIHLYRRDLFDGTSDAAALAGDHDLQSIARMIASASDDPMASQRSDWRWHPAALASDIVAYREPFLARQSGVRTH